MPSKSQYDLLILIIILITHIFFSVISVKADSESYWFNNWEKNESKRLSSGTTGYEGYEINRPAVLNGSALSLSEIYILTSEPFSKI